MKILLHACCGPCSLEPVRLLAEEGHSLTIAYMNSNIHPQSEYTQRLKTLLAWAQSENIAVVEGGYNVAAWRESAGRAQQEDQPREMRCRLCYRMRLEEAARYAYEHGFDGLASTLTVSPYQYTQIIEEELTRACKLYGLQAVFRDYRPYYPRATKRSRDLGMYRQNYCGCVYSDEEARLEREQRKAAREAQKAAKAAARAQQEAQAAQERQRKARQRAEYDRKQHAKREMRNKWRQQAKQQALEQAKQSAQRARKQSGQQESL